jgi:hypothetical protein
MTFIFGLLICSLSGNIAVHGLGLRAGIARSASKATPQGEAKTLEKARSGFTPQEQEVLAELGRNVGPKEAAAAATAALRRKVTAEQVIGHSLSLRQAYASRDSLWQERARAESEEARGKAESELRENGDSTETPRRAESGVPVSRKTYKSAANGDSLESADFGDFGDCVVRPAATPAALRKLDERGVESLDEALLEAYLEEKGLSDDSAARTELAGVMLDALARQNFLQREEAKKELFISKEV